MLQCNETRLEAFKYNYIPQIQAFPKCIRWFSHTGGLNFPALPLETPVTGFILGEFKSYSLEVGDVARKYIYLINQARGPYWENIGPRS